MLYDEHGNRRDFEYMCHHCGKILPAAVVVWAPVGGHRVEPWRASVEQEASGKTHYIQVSAASCLRGATMTCAAAGRPVRRRVRPLPAVADCREGQLHVRLVLRRVWPADERPSALRSAASEWARARACLDGGADCETDASSIDRSIGSISLSRRCQWYIDKMRAVTERRAKSGKHQKSRRGRRRPLFGVR